MGAFPAVTPPAITVEIARGIQPVQDGRVFIELINVHFLRQGGTGEQFSAAVALAQERGWLELHESGTYVRLPGTGASVK
ncbi:hypothetical protein XI05_06945 [Bradyrhizobium sp. CCBAU 11357]|nr:hypothetical protein [Bradyrhizobium sp. CCBAU 11357]